MTAPAPARGLRQRRHTWESVLQKEVSRGAAGLDPDHCHRVKVGKAPIRQPLAWAFQEHRVDGSLWPGAHPENSHHQVLARAGACAQINSLLITQRLPLVDMLGMGARSHPLGPGSIGHGCLCPPSWALDLLVVGPPPAQSGPCMFWWSLPRSHPLGTRIY